MGDSERENRVRRLAWPAAVLAGCLVGALALSSTKVRADSGDGPEPLGPPCKTDADCPGCGRCRDGFCPAKDPSGAECMCNAECEAKGATSCDLSVEKPLCGGVCVDAPKTRELTCGAGDDSTKLAPFDGGGPGEAGGARPLAGPEIVIEPWTGGTP